MEPERIPSFFVWSQYQQFLRLSPKNIVTVFVKETLENLTSNHIPCFCLYFKKKHDTKKMQKFYLVEFHYAE